MPGVDKDRLVGVPEDTLNEFTCGICHGLFGEPVVTPCCRQTYCKECITEWLNLNHICPNDRRPLQVIQLAPVPLTLVNIMATFPIKCRYVDSGCPVITSIGEEPNHVRTACEHNPDRRCNKCGGLKDLAADQQHSCTRYLADLVRSAGESTRDLLNGMAQLQENMDTNVESALIEMCSLQNEVQELKTREETYRARIDSLSSTVNTLLSQMARMEAELSRIKTQDNLGEYRAESSQSITSVSTISFTDNSLE